MFGGIGTVCDVAIANGMRGISIEGSPTYTEFAWDRLRERAELWAKLRIV